MSANSGSVSKAMVWMFVLSILLFWLPVAGPLIAGFVGGRKAGSVSNAILAAILPGLAVGAVFFFLASYLITDTWFWGYNGKYLNYNHWVPVGYSYSPPL